MNKQNSNGPPLLADPERGPQRERYQDLYVASHPRHLDAIPADSETLVVVTEWAALQIARERGLDAVHVDWGWTRGQGPCVPAGEVYRQAYAWLGADGTDPGPVSWKGVSLGTLYATFLSNSILQATRIDACLRYLCATFSIVRIVVFDVSTVFNAVGPSAKRHLIRQIGSDLGLVIDERWNLPDAEDRAFFWRSIVPRTPRWTARNFLSGVVGRMVELTFRLLSRKCRQPRVYLFISLASLRSLVQREPRGITPVIPFTASPKTGAFLRDCWRNGILPAGPSCLAPAREYAGTAAALAEAVENIWRSRPATGIEAVYREVVRESVLDHGILAGLVQMVDDLDKLMDRLRIRRVLSGDASAPMGRALCELARAKGIGADETLNGVFIGPRCDPVRLEHGGECAPVTRELALGPAIERWLALSGTPLPCVVTGYPALGQVEPGRLAPPGRKKALVLPLNAGLNDPGAWSSKLSPVLVDMIRGLAALGYDSIRLKLHPGMSNFDYYRWLIDHFHLPCALDQHGAFQAHLQWADVVVGPAGSGTFLETLAARKPYYVLRPQPTDIPDELLDGAVVGATAKDICAAIAAGRIPDRDRILALWCGVDQVEDPATAVWAAIGESLAEKEAR